MKHNIVKYTLLIFINFLFLSIAVLIAIGGKWHDIPLFLLPLFILATMRLSHTISNNEIMEWLRAPFCEVRKDSCGAGDNVHPRHKDGIFYIIGSLLACPICSGTWAALSLVGAWAIVPPLGKVLIYVLGFAGGSELLHYLKEWMEWSGRSARVVSGKMSPD